MADEQDFIAVHASKNQELIFQNNDDHDLKDDLEHEEARRVGILHDLFAGGVAGTG